MQSMIKFKYKFLLIFFIIFFFFEENVSDFAETNFYKKNTINGKQHYKVGDFQNDIKITGNELSNIYLSGNKSFKYFFPSVYVYLRNRYIFSDSLDYRDITFLPSTFDNNTESKHFFFHNLIKTSKNTNGIGYFCF